MNVEAELARFSAEKDTMLTIGVFDGVHLGHKYLLAQLKEHARQQNLLSGVVTFRQHPLEVLSSQTGLAFLTDLDTRTSLLKAEGIDLIITLSFTPELAQLSATEFISLLEKHLRMRALLVGPDFSLGRDRETDSNSLHQLGTDMNLAVIVVPHIMLDGAVVSSTAIRQALAKGDMERVLNLTGRSFSLHGRVTTGAGRAIGFPTANLEIDPRQALPADGVYATLVDINGRTYKSVTNIGQRPTFGRDKRTVEVHILDYGSRLYGRELKIDIIKRLRPEKQFESNQRLKDQIAEDIELSRAILDC
jgi:riboflavin kinase/FMN adenylyltransferase